MYIYIIPESINILPSSISFRNLLRRYMLRTALVETRFKDSRAVIDVVLLASCLQIIVVIDADCSSDTVLNSSRVLLHVQAVHAPR